MDREGELSADRLEELVVDSERLTRVVETDGRVLYREELDRDDPWLKETEREAEDREEDGAAKEDWDRELLEDEAENEDRLEEKELEEPRLEKLPEEPLLEKPPEEPRLEKLPLEPRLEKLPPEPPREAP